MIFDVISFESIARLILLYIEYSLPFVALAIALLIVIACMNKKISDEAKKKKANNLVVIETCTLVAAFALLLVAYINYAIGLFLYYIFIFITLVIEIPSFIYTLKNRNK